MSVNTRGWRRGSQTSLSAVHLTGNGDKSNPKELHLNTWKLLFTLRVIKHWNRLPREVCQVSTLGDFQNLTGHGFEKPVLGDLALLEQVAGLDGLKMMVPPNPNRLVILLSFTGRFCAVNLNYYSSSAVPFETSVWFSTHNIVVHWATKAIKMSFIR